MGRRGKVQVFSLSFLDVLSCALGGVLLLLLLNMDNSQKVAVEQSAKAIAWEKQVEYMQTRIDYAVAALDSETTARKAAEDAAETARQAAEDAAKKVKQAQVELIGWKGKMKNVVFIFDTSGSMGRSNRFPDYQNILKRWVKIYPFDKFNVIDYDTVVKPWKPELQSASQQNRQAALSFIDSFITEGGTATKSALEKAFQMKGIDTIILLSDGEPTEPAGSDANDVLHFVRQNIPNGVVINTIAMGNHEGTHREFLAKLAAENGGSFQGI